MTCISQLKKLMQLHQTVVSQASGNPMTSISQAAERKKQPQQP